MPCHPSLSEWSRAISTAALMLSSIAVDVAPVTWKYRPGVDGCEHRNSCILPYGSCHFSRDGTLWLRMWRVHTKFQRRALHMMALLTAFEVVIVDSGIPSEVLHELNQRIDVVVAEEPVQAP
jgi:hypothetical protein